MGFKTGDTELFTWEESDKDLYKLTCDKIDEHEDELQSIDLLVSKGLFVTGGRDGLVKVWNLKKELIREIKFPEPITAVNFMNPKGDILVGHVGKVSSILASDYKPFEFPLTEEESTSFLTSISIRESVTDLTFKKLKK
jgi:WD40 repeat protein